MNKVQNINFIIASLGFTLILSAIYFELNRIRTILDGTIGEAAQEVIVDLSSIKGY